MNWRPGSNVTLIGLRRKASAAIVTASQLVTAPVLARVLPDGRLRLLDGHLRRDLEPDMHVHVEILDVTDDEARKLLLTIDPLADLAEMQEQLHQRLMEMTPTDSDAFAVVWQSAGAEVLEREPDRLDAIPEQFLILIICRNEKQQVELLGRFGAEGLECRAMMT